VTRAAGLLALVALLGCSDLASGEAGIATIEVKVPFPATVERGDSLHLAGFVERAGGEVEAIAARALNEAGDSVAANIFWVTPDTTILTVDSATGIVAGVSVGQGRVQALSGSLASALVTINVVEPTPPTP